ncbi:phosphoribosyltransferase family protein [Pelomonas sp. SE-A7]|uniref:ComF family protein n=1 Tax=Pelomonas sp. SE-A7 TaxID=3054953 RepID=UPI00259D1B89|nr:phosphoribosyltransferase family protein [Pelomonas sp. SE-A7]MDM4767591.1 phosphoribosyltransferase family protein [Pelomonas sp. SE-A7]
MRLATVDSPCLACLREQPPLDRCVAALDYAFPWDRLLQRYKFHQGIELRRPLLDLLDQSLDAAEVAMPDWLLAVPLSEQRLRERGYNQAHELAKALAQRRGLRCDADLLQRLRQGPSQSSLPLAERKDNVKQSFAVEPSRLAELRGTQVALLDDVMTTGATLFELARSLRQAGVAGVQAWVLARTPAAQ